MINVPVPIYLFVHCYFFLNIFFLNFYLKAVTLVSAVQERPDSMSSED